MLQANAYGEVVSVPASVPSTKSSTRLTPTLSLALAETVTVPLTVAPFSGAVIDVVGGVVSPGFGPPKRASSSRFGDPVPAFVTLFAVAFASSACVAVDGEAVGFVSR